MLGFCLLVPDNFTFKDMKIKNLPKIERPREKLGKYGPAAFVRNFMWRRERLSDSGLLT